MRKIGKQDLSAVPQGSKGKDRVQTAGGVDLLTKWATVDKHKSREGQGEVDTGREDRNMSGEETTGLLLQF